jgi:hypothetical protein
MDVHKIKYCNNSGFIIKNDRTKHDIIKSIEDNTGINLLTTYEKSYSDKLKSSFKNTDMFVTYITYGKQTYLYLTKLYNENIALIIETQYNDKNKYPKIISIPLHFHKSMYNGTLFLGEIYKINNSSKWVFLVEKLHMLNNRSYTNNIIKNIEIINDILNNSYSYMSLSPFKILAKRYFTLNKIDENLTELNNNNIRLKGIKFYGLNKPINFYFNTRDYNNMKFKFNYLPNKTNSKTLLENKNQLIKDLEDNATITSSGKMNIKYIPTTLYLELRKTDTYGIYELFASVDKKFELKKVGKAIIKKIEISVQIINDTRKAFIVKCFYNYKFKKFNVVQINKSRLSKYSDVIKEIEKTANYPIPNYIQ